MTKGIVENLLYKDLSYKIHGAAIEVRKDFGPGHKEKLYQEAFAKELTRRGLKFAKEKAIKIYAPKDGEYIGLYRPDFIVEDKIIIELKAEKFVSQEEIKRIYDYLRNSEYELAYFINFASSKLFVRRIIYTNDRKPLISLPKNANKFLVAIGLILVLVSGGLPTARAETPSIFIVGPKDLPVAGSEFVIKILLSSTEPLNAYSFDMSYPPQDLEVLIFDTSRSIINIWQSQPTLPGAGRISFKGGSTAPFRGDGGELISVHFRSLTGKVADFNVLDAAVYLADGEGTKIVPLISGIVSETNFANNAEFEKDTTPPEIETLSIVPDPFDSSRKILSFAMRDAESGIKEASARSRKWLFWSAWQAITNPVALPSGAWAIHFKAENNAGHTTEKTIYDWAVFAKGPLILLVVFGIIAVFLINRVIMRRKSYNKS